MKILIATGIYPPEIGGPAEYAKNLGDTWASQGHEVIVKIFGRFRKVPWGIRHIVFLLYILPAVAKADYILGLDSFSAGVVVVAAKLFGKKVIFRTGGDALWESYVERTGDLVLLKDFYQKRIGKLSPKEKITFYLTRWALRNLAAIVWSTEWQKNIFMKPYGLEKQRHFIVENYYGSKLPSHRPSTTNFVAATRKLKWKNADLVEKAFREGGVAEAGGLLDTATVPHDAFLEKLASSYAVIIASLGDISPNTILDAIRLDKPFILTRENGLSPRIKDIGLFVDPQDPKDIAEKARWLLDPANYEAKRSQIVRFTFTHTWEDMAREYLDIWQSL
ncbi:hypothetical protein KW784_01200 [Candidatus Parcubacteria bacterium]|nr:hypothetical protein [Candidatus Parcubacteria bacterium]